MRSLFCYFFLVITILIFFNCKRTLHIDQKIDYLNYFPGFHRSIYILDSLALNNHRKEAIYYYQTINKINFTDTELVYLNYRYNKTVFLENYYSRDTIYNFNCDRVRSKYSSKLISILNILNDYYSDQILQLNQEQINTLLNYSSNSFILQSPFRIELFNEIGRYYYNEGFIEADTAIKYYEISLALSNGNKETILYYETLKTLVYLQIPKRDKNKFIYYASKFKPPANNLYNFTLENQIQELYLKGMAFFYNSEKKLGMLYYKEAFTKINHIKYQFVTQEVYKTYISFRSWYIDTIGVKDKLQELENIIKNEGDFNNFNRIKGEYFYDFKNINLETYNYLKRAYSYSCIQKPYMKTQALTILNMLGMTCNALNYFNEALDVLYTENGKYFSRGIKKFNIDSIANYSFQSQKFNFVSFQGYCNVLISKYLFNNKLSNLILADSLCSISEKILNQNFYSLYEENLTIILEQINSVYVSGQKINYLLYNKLKNKKYILKYLYYLELSKNSLLYRNIRLDLVKNEKLREYHDMELLFNAKILYFKSLSNYGDSLKFYADKLDSLGLTTFNLKNYKVFDLSLNKLNYNPIYFVENSKKYSHRTYVDVNYTKNGLYIFSIRGRNMNLVYKSVSDKFSDTIIYLVNSQHGAIVFDQQKYSNYSFNLYRKLFSTIKFRKFIVISTNDILTQLNPEALIADSLEQTDSIPHYFIFNHVIEYTPSIRLYLNSLTIDTSRKNIAAFFYSDEISIKKNNIDMLPELPGNIFESKMLKSYTKLLNLFSGYECSKNNFINLTGKYGIVHIGTHGKGSDQKISDLFLFMRGKNKMDTIYIYDLLTMKWQAELVILSSCESKMGKLVVGEGVYSLSRFFLLNNTKKVISSIWNIDDKCGAIILGNIYKHKLNNGNFSEALTNSKIEFIKEFPRYSKPYYWASLL